MTKGRRESSRYATPVARGITRPRRDRPAARAGLALGRGVLGVIRAILG
jgi:hypothetical protein